MYGWAGTILRIKLDKQSIKKQLTPKDLCANFIGGRGFNSKILYDEVRPAIDPLGSENKLIFGTGPLVGTVAPCAGRWTVTAKSPITEAFGDANAGGHWGAELKWSGYDCIVFDGVANEPSYLLIDDEHVELRDARHIWGLDIWETDKAIKEEIGDPDIKIASIGQAGENLVSAACVVSDLTRGAGRCGIGAVMGSKKLKAVAIRGTKGVKIAKPEEFLKLCEETIELVRKDKWWWEHFRKWGTPIFVMLFQHLGMLPTRNWSEGTFEYAEDISGETLLRNYVFKKRSCFACIFHCSGAYLIRDGPYAGYMGEGVEYEATGGFGSKMGNRNLESTLVCKTLCDRYGLDLINTTDVIAWAMESYNKGILTEKDTDGLDLTWGNHENIIECVRRLAFREGHFGELLAMGSRKAAEKIGRGSEYYVMNMKGAQPGLVEPRGGKAWALSYATSTRGGCHLRGMPNLEYYWTPQDALKYLGSTKAVDRFAYEDKGRLVAWVENVRAIDDSLELCKYLFRGEPRVWVEMPTKLFNAATGLNYTENDILKCGERIYNVEKAFNTREGLNRSHDTLPERYFKESMPAGPSKGEVIPRDKFEEMLNDYYSSRGWDVKTGLPTKKKLEELGLKYISDELEKMNKLGKTEQ